MYWTSKVIVISVMMCAVWIGKNYATVIYFHLKFHLGASVITRRNLFLLIRESTKLEKIVFSPALLIA